MIHAVWGTKSREPFLVQGVRQAVINHIRENALQKNIFIDAINGYVEHLHCLLELHHEISIAKTMQLIKGESSYWINKEKITKSKFEWADEYFAVSVSESMLPNVRAYIAKQEEHHKKVTFEMEYQEFIKKYHFEVCV